MISFIRSAIKTMALSPLLIITSLILVPLAFITTFLAMAALTLRVSAVYIELFVAVVQHQLGRSKRSRERSRRKSSPSRPKRPRSVRSVSSSSSSQYSVHGQGLYMAQSPLDRDFEGIGGWRFAVDDKEETQWTALNSRLELPVGSIPDERKRRHQRSLTASTTVSERGTPRRTPNHSRPRSAIFSGTNSPEDLFMGPASAGGRVMSMTALIDGGLPVAKTWRRRKSSSSSSSSGKTLTLQPQAVKS